MEGAVALTITAIAPPEDCVAPIGSVWRAWHSQGEDVLLVTGEPAYDGRRVYVPVFVMTTGEEITTWLNNFPTWERLL